MRSLSFSSFRRALLRHSLVFRSQGGCCNQIWYIYLNGCCYIWNDRRVSLNGPQSGFDFKSVGAFDGMAWHSSLASSFFVVQKKKKHNHHCKSWPYARNSCFFDRPNSFTVIVHKIALAHSQWILLLFYQAIVSFKRISMIVPFKDYCKAHTVVWNDIKRRMIAKNDNRRTIEIILKLVGKENVEE